jgi:hypothetical protein
MNRNRSKGARRVRGSNSADCAAQTGARSRARRAVSTSACPVIAISWRAPPASKLANSKRPISIGWSSSAS